MIASSLSLLQRENMNGTRQLLACCGATVEAQSSKTA
jgi:hypothetical protein